jgi:GxxExxY protein
VDNLIFKEEFFRIKKACIEVRKTLGNGFLEKVYENALLIELELLGFIVKTQTKLNVLYKNKVIGDYIADIIVDDKIIIELKCVSKITNVHKAQLLNYLKATVFKLGILINFPNDKLGFEIERIPNFITTNK